MSIADVGGGSGPYAFWLAEKGHKVALFDLMPNHVEEAVSINKKAPNPLYRIETADVRSLELESQQYDVVLLLGPMYHLTDANERSLVLRKVTDWLSPNGVGYVAYISRFGSMLDGFISGLFEDPEYLDIARQDLETGVHHPNKDNTKYFTDAYCHHPDEIEREAEEAHLQIVDHVAVEGVGWLWQNFDQIWSDPRQRTIMLEMIDRTDRDRSILGASGHILLVVKRRELGFTAHVEGRMEERGFSEIELRTMLDNATKLVPAHHPGRWVIHTRHAGQPWRVVVEPDSDDQILMTVTAYPEEVRP